VLGRRESCLSGKKGLEANQAMAIEMQIWISERNQSVAGQSEGLVRKFVVKIVVVQEGCNFLVFLG
jgi:hypothetical protein